MIEAGLGAVHFADDFLLDAGGKVAGDFFFGAAQEEGADAGGKTATGEGIGFGVEVFHKKSAGTKGSRLGKGHDAPEIKEAVFHGSSAEGKPVIRSQGAGDFSRLGGWIFDILGFVKDDGQPGLVLEEGLVLPELLIVNDEKAGEDSVMADGAGGIAGPGLDG